MFGPEVWELGIALVESSPIASIFMFRKKHFLLIALKNRCFPLSAESNNIILPNKKAVDPGV